MSTYRDEEGNYITERDGIKFVSDEHGNELVDEDGFVTYIGDFGF